jgi:hypothetical protein
MAATTDSGAALPSTTWQKYADYALPVDPKQNDRATSINLLSFKKPHMRAFWVSVSIRICNARVLSCYAMAYCLQRDAGY